MTAPTKPSPPDEPEAVDIEPEDDRRPWTAAMLAGARFTPVGRGSKVGYARDEVDLWQERVGAWGTAMEKKYAGAYQQVRQLQEANSQRHDPKRPPLAAVAAVAGAQAQAEADLGRAREELRRVRARTRTMWEQAETVLRQAEDSGGVPAEPDLPDPPQGTGDPVADLNARREHLQQVAAALDEWETQVQTYFTERRAKLAEGRGALAEQRDGFVNLLDELADAVPAVRAQVVAIETVETSGAEGQVAS